MERVSGILFDDTAAHSEEVSVWTLLGLLSEHDGVHKPTAAMHDSEQVSDPRTHSDPSRQIPTQHP